MRLANSAALLCLILGCTPSAPQPTGTRVVSIASPPASSPPPTARAATPPAAKASSGDAFGGERWGFAEATSMNGRLVALRRFQGSDLPTFGQHGESSTGTDLALFDTVAGSERAIDEVIDIDAKRRWLLIGAKGLWLVDAASGEFAELAQVDDETDQNACLPARQANFSTTGSRVAWIAKGSGELKVRDLDTRAEWSVAAGGRLWRAWPDDAGHGATLLEVAAGTSGWPEQHTSCACQWCRRFAASYGFYGWAGPAFNVMHVDDSGVRTKGEAPNTNAAAFGPTDRGCTLQATQTNVDTGLERGPWHWKCP